MTLELGFEQLEKMLHTHLVVVHDKVPVVNRAPAAATVKTEKILRPRLTLKNSQVEEESFQFFEHRWAEYKVTARIKERAKRELAACLSDKASHDQPIQTYMAYLKATTRICNYKVKCDDALCGKLVDFTELMAERDETNYF